LLYCSVQRVHVVIKIGREKKELGGKKKYKIQKHAKECTLTDLFERVRFNFFFAFFLLFSSRALLYVTNIQ